MPDLTVIIFHSALFVILFYLTGNIIWGISDYDFE